VDEAIIASRISYSIIRPTVIYGTEDILINNIAWFLRRFPIFAVSGSGNYRIQPVHVADVANAAIAAGCRSDNIIWDVCGSETYTFNSLVRLIAEKIGSKARIIHLQPELSLLFAKLLGYLLQDVVLTRDEINGLMSNMLVSNNFRAGQMRFVDWLEANVNSIGLKYVSELKRHYRL
jgi:NADH dehydrogenase